MITQPLVVSSLSDVVRDARSDQESDDMADKRKFPVGELENSRLRRLEEAGFANLIIIPDLDALCKEAKSHFGTDVAAITLLTEDLQLLKARAGIDIDQTPRGVAFCNYTILADAVFVVLDASKDPRFSDNPVTTGHPFIRFYAGAPLTYLGDIRIGAFCLLDSSPRESFTKGEQAELIDFSERALQILVKQLGRVT